MCAGTAGTASSGRAGAVSLKQRNSTEKGYGMKSTAFVKRRLPKAPDLKRDYTPADSRVRSRVMAKARARREGKAERRHDEVVKLARAGMSDEQIAEETGYKKDSIRRIVNQMRREGVDIPHRKRGRKKCVS